MFSLLLCVIYLAFISLGLPDSLLASGWPSMHLAFNTDIGNAGIISMLISIGTIISSLMSDKLTKKFGSGKITFVSVVMTSVTMFAFSMSKHFWQLVILAIPYGLGAGGVDATLNNYVALHYSSKHMSWLHCFWGVGASISPYIMGFCLTKELGWESGYLTVSVIQIILAILIFISLPLWKTNNNQSENTETQTLSFVQKLKIKGVIWVLIMFFIYCALEQTSMLWASTYLVKVKNVDEKTAANLASLVFLGITSGRFLAGFVTEKFGDKKMIRSGSVIAILSIMLLLIPVSNNLLCYIGLFFIGFGCAPVYPSIIHSTPENFGKENSQSIIGLQMAFAYLGTTFMPLLFGLVSKYLSLKLYPFYILLFAILLLVLSEILNLVLKNNKK